MKNQSRVTTIVGTLYIIGTIAGILSVSPEVDHSEYLTKAFENTNKVVLAAFFQFMMAFAYLSIPIILYPTIRRYNEKLAIGFLSFRILAASLVVLGALILLLILAISHEFSHLKIPESSCIQLFGDLLRTARDLVNHVAMIIILSIGSIMLNFLLFLSKLIPRWLSIWGFIGAISTIVSSFLVMFKLVDIITPIYIILNIPMALQELFFAIRLIIKGFDRNDHQLITN